MSSRDAKAQLK